MMLFMLAISLSTIKTFQAQQKSKNLSILDQQLAMSIMMAIAFAYTYITVIIVNVKEIFKRGKI